MQRVRGGSYCSCSRAVYIVALAVCLCVRSARLGWTDNDSLFIRLCLCVSVHLVSSSLSPSPRHPSPLQRTWPTWSTVTVAWSTVWPSASSSGHRKVRHPSSCWFITRWSWCVMRCRPDSASIPAAGRWIDHIMWARTFQSNMFNCGQAKSCGTIYDLTYRLQINLYDGYQFLKNYRLSLYDHRFHDTNIILVGFLKKYIYTIGFVLKTFWHFLSSFCFIKCISIIYLLQRIS